VVSQDAAQNDHGWPLSGLVEGDGRAVPVM
jgi:hypothetical protein